MADEMSPPPIRKFLDTFGTSLLDCTPELLRQLREKEVVGQRRMIDSTVVADLTSHITSVEKNMTKGGGFCDVYTGVLVNRKVAMRALRYVTSDEDKLKKRFNREVKLWASINHPRILPFLGTAESQSRLFMISPWMENGNADEYLRNHQEASRRRILLQTAEALQYLHSKKIVHGDIRPDNVLIDDHGDALLADFGLSALRDDLAALSTSTSSLLRNAGAYRFMAPELISLSEDRKEESQSRRTFQSDVYAFGGLIYQIASGRQPFDHIPNNFTVPLAIMEGTTSQRPTPFPDDLWILCESCWRTKPEERPTMASISALLEV